MSTFVGRKDGRNWKDHVDPVFYPIEYKTKDKKGVSKKEEKLKKLLKKKSYLVKEIKKIEEENEDILWKADSIEHEIFTLECDKDEIDMEIKDLRKKIKEEKKK